MRTELLVLLPLSEHYPLRLFLLQMFLTRIHNSFVVNEELNKLVYSTRNHNLHDLHLLVLDRLRVEKVCLHLSLLYLHQP